MTAVIETIAAASIEAREILLGCAPGPADPLTTWAIGAWAAWHAAHLASAWDHGTIVDTDTKGSTLSDGRRWRSITATRREAILVGRGHQVVTVRLADAVKLVDQHHLPAALVADVREVLAERHRLALQRKAAFQQNIETGRPADDAAAQASNSAAIERRCQQLASDAWAHVRPAATLFDLAGVAG